MSCWNRNPAADGTASHLWSLTYDDCLELAVHRIKRLVLADAAVPYHRVRVRPTGSFLGTDDKVESIAWHPGRPNSTAALIVAEFRPGPSVVLLPR
jgi:hypothetical protein